jgi:hypothetical protein
MAVQGIGTGSSPNDGNGDSLLAGALKINSNFDELYTLLGDGATLTSNVVNELVAGSNVSLSATTGKVTISATASASALDSVWRTTDVGINTVSNVGIGSTGPESALTVSGDAKVSGVVTATSFVGDLTGDVTGGASQVFISTTTTNSVTNTSWLVPFVDGSGGSNKPLYITGAGWGIRWFNPSKALFVTNSTDADQSADPGAGKAIIRPNDITIGANVKIDGSSGIITATTLEGNATGLTGTPDLNVGIVTGVSFVGSGTALTGVSVGSTDYITGIAITMGAGTFTGNVSIGGTTSIEGGVTLATNNATVSGTIGTTGEIKQIGGVPFYYDGSDWREFVLSTGVSTTQTADTSWDNVILRSTYDTNFFDSKFEVHPIKTGAGATNVSSPVKIGTKSYRNNGSAGAGLSYAYRSEYDFTGPWTIEFWIYFDATPGQNVSLVSQISTTDTTNNWTFGLVPISSNQYWMWSNEAGGELTLAVTANSTFGTDWVNEWNHVALTRESSDGSIHLYLNGVESTRTSGVVGTGVDNDITSTNGAGLYIGGIESDTIESRTFNNTATVDAFFDDLRISTVSRYTSVGISTTTTFTPSTTALETTGTLTSSYTPPGNKRGVIALGASPSWKGSPGCTVSQQSSGNYRVTFATPYISNLDYSVLSQAADQGYASYVGIARSTEHVDISVNKQSDDSAVDTGYLSVQITNL